MKRVVLIAYYFPPTGGVSVARMLRTAQFLPSYGWEAIVVAPRASGHAIQDPASIADIPDSLKVVRTPCPEPGHLRLRVDATRVNRGVEGDSLAAGGSCRVALVRPLARSARRAAAVGSRSLFPDEQVGWLPFGVVAAVRAVRSLDADAILSSSAPVSAHLIGMTAAKLTRVPWIADFRDPWVGNPLDRQLPRVTSIARETLESRIVRSAASCTFATPHLTAAYQARYPRFANRMGTVPNGYSRAERVAAPPRDPDHYSIAFTGTLDRVDEVTMFVAGLRIALNRSPALRNRLRVRLAGVASPACEGVLREAQRSSDLGSVVEWLGPLPRDKALALVDGADAALVLLAAGPGMNMFVGGKLYDYLGRDRQILAIVPDGDASAVLNELAWGVVAAPTPAGVAGGIDRLLSSSPGRDTADPEGRYDRFRLTRLFAAALDRAVAR